MRLLLTALLLFATGCGNTAMNGLGGFARQGPRVEAPAEAPSLRGTLTRLSTSTSGGMLLIEERPGTDAGAKASVQLTSKTAMIRPDGFRLAFRELEVGQTLEVWFEGPVAESYPVQGTARAVRLVQ